MNFFSNFVKKCFFFQFCANFGIGILSLCKNIDLQEWFAVLISAAALKLEFLQDFEKSRFSKFFDFFGKFVEKSKFSALCAGFKIFTLFFYKNIDLNGQFAVLRRAAALKLEFWQDFEKSRFSKFFDFLGKFVEK